MSDRALPSDPGTASPPRRGMLAKLGRVVTVMQAIGAVLAVPFGMTGAYSVYSNNLSTEATCKGLRGSIVAAIDKNVDLDTRRRLIRRDVEAFEQSCAGFDPDAVEAFKIVLSKDGGETAAAPVMPPPVAEGTVPLPVPRPVSLPPAQPRRDGGHDTKHADIHRPEVKPAEVKGAPAEARTSPVPAVTSVAAVPASPVAGPAPQVLDVAPEPAPVVPDLPPPVAMPAPPFAETPAHPPVAMPAPPFAETPAHPPVATRARPPAWTPVRPPADVIGVPATPRPEDRPVQPQAGEPGPWRYGNLMR